MSPSSTNGQAPGAPPRASTAEYKASLRRAIRKNAVEPEINFLNITAMLDIMTIILVFLLKSLGESTASVPQSDDLTLPTSVLQTEPSQTGVVVTVTKTQLLVGDNKVLTLPSREAMVQAGVGATHKRNGPDDLYIVPLGSALQAARKTDKMIQQRKGLDGAVSEAVVITDRTTPYRLLVEVLFTLGQAEFGKYHLMVIQSKGTGQ